MTKTYDFVTLYYKGHSPLKKEDNSFLLCLYTMLFVLFAMVTILLLCTFYNIEPTESKRIYVHDEPQQQKKPFGSTTKPTTTPTAPHVDHNYYYEETAKPIIDWDNVVDFFVGSEEVEASNHPNAASSQRTPTSSQRTPTSSQRTPTSSVWNGSHEEAESRTNQSATVIRSTKEEERNQVTSVSSPIQEPTNQGSAFVVTDFRSSTEPQLKTSVPMKEYINQAPTFGVEDISKATISSTVPPAPPQIHEDTSKKSELDVEHSTKAMKPPKVPSVSTQTPENTNQEPAFDIEEFNNTIKGPPQTSSAPEDVNKESKSIVEDAKGTTQASKGTNTSPVEVDFNEWPEAVAEVLTTTSPREENPNREVEWVPTVENLPLGNKTGRFKVQKDCTSARCEIAASKMLSSINLSIEPCSNFYSFACGGVSTRRGRMEPESFTENYISDLDFVRKFKWLYKSCLDHENYFDYHDRIQRTKDVLSDIGMFNFDQERSNKDVTDVVASLIMLDAMPLFNIDIDITNSTFILKLIPPDGTLSSKYWSPLAETRKNCLRSTQPENYHSPLDITFLYYDYQKCQENHKDYLKSIETSIEELGNFGINTQKQERIKDAVEFVQKKLLPILDQTFNFQEKVVNLEYVTMNIRDLRDQFPIIDWYKFFRVISSNDMNITSSVQVYNKAYFEVLFKKLSSFDKDRLFRAFSAILIEKYYQEVVLPTPKHSRAKYCSKLCGKFLPDISNYLSQSEEMSEDFEERKKYIQSLFHNMKQDLQDSLQNLEWLDEKSSTSMRNKIADLKLEMSQDSLTEESIYLEKFYERLDLEEGDYSRNYVEATKFRRKHFFSLHGKPADTLDILRNFVDNSKEEPVFFYGHNVVCIPDGLVHKTFMDFPKYLIMAKIGFPLARVLGHALDPLGLKFGESLSENVSSIYDKFVQESLRSLPHHLVFHKLNLVFSLNNQISGVERIAENSAMALVTKTIEEIQNQPLLPLVSYTFSREKIFFMALVQEFCTDTSLMEFVVQAHENAVLPAQFRVQNILQNSEAFHDAFSCRPSAKVSQLQFPYLSFLLPKDGDKTN